MSRASSAHDKSVRNAPSSAGASRRRGRSGRVPEVRVEVHPVGRGEGDALGAEPLLHRRRRDEVEAAGQDELILTGRTLLAASGRTLTLISTEDSPQVRQTLNVEALQTEESIARDSAGAARVAEILEAFSSRTES